MIRVSELRKRYGDVAAVDGISFEVQPHETFGLLGPNGAGKTTTIHLMVGLVSADGGRIDINGCGDPTRPDVRRHIGVAPQTLSVYEEMTAAENLTFFGRLYGLGSGQLRLRVAEGLQRAGLTGRRDDLVKTFSTGMKRRLHLAIALVHAPQVVLLDEPTVGIDPQARHRILDDIAALKHQGRTIILTTHYIEEAQRLCDRVAIIDHGRILAMDTVRAMIERHGGRTTVRADLEAAPADPSRFPGRLEGQSVTIETDQPFEAIRGLAATGEAICDLSVQHPNLETVFLKLTGRRLRD